MRVDGAFDTGDTGSGISPQRLDPALAHQHPVEVAFVQAMSSGVRLVVATDAPELTLGCTPTRLALGGADPLPATFDLVVDDRRVDSVRADHGHVVAVDLDGGAELIAGGPGEVVLGGLPGEMSVVEIWLPHAAGVEIHSIRVPDGSTVAAAPADERPRWVHHGSSISHCLESERPTETWPATVASAAGLHLVDLGLAGQCHLDQFSARTIRDLPADRISLELGINVVNADSMTLRTFTSAVHGFIDTVRDGHPRTPVLVVSPIHCPAVEDVPGPTVLTDSGRIEAKGTPAGALFGRPTLTAIRAALRSAVQARAAAGDGRISYLDGLELFGPDDADDLVDGLHPTPAGYLRIADRFARRPFARG